MYIYSGYVTASDYSEYYVSAAPNGVPCPSTDLPCHDLSYYTDDYESYFTDDTIFYFQEGTHTLQGTLEISNVSNITLQGLGHIEQGFHETVMQSTSVLRCSNYDRTSIQFTSSAVVVLKSLTIANCGGFYDITYQQTNINLLFVDTHNILLEWVSIQNSSGDGLVLYNTFDLLIANSTFTNNGGPKTFVNNVIIFSDDQLERVSRVSIMKSNFTLGSGYGISLSYVGANKIEIFIKNSIFSHNTYGGGVYIDLYNGNGSIEFSSCTIYNNSAQQYGGGLHVDLYNGSGSIEFNNCTIYNNFAWQYGGGAFVNLYNGSGSIDFSSCTIYNNTSLQKGGGAFIELYNGSGSIEFDNCTIYNNAAPQYGGGAFINLYNGNGSIEFSNCTIYNNTAHIYGGGAFITLYKGSGSIEFSNCTISNNTAYFGSGLCVFAYKFTSTTNLYFTNVLFHYNKIPKKFDKYQSALLLINIEYVKFEQIEVSNHNTTGLLSFNSQLTFDKNNTFVNNSGIYGGGIALYESSQLLLKEHGNVSFVNNHAKESGGGIFVSQSLGLNSNTVCSFKVISNHLYSDTKTVLYFVNNTADISGDVLYGGKISDCLDFNFDCVFDYRQQIGLSPVSSDPIQVCFCESNRQNCSITNISITSIPGIDVNISLATVGIKDGLTKGVIKLTTDNSSNNIVQYDNDRLNATCTNVTFTLTTNLLLNTTQVYVTLESSISDPSSDDFAKVLEVTIESCPIGFPLVKDTCICNPQLNSPPITCDINSQIITRDGDMWIGYKNDSDCLIVYQNCPFDYCNDGTVQFKITSPDVQCLHNRSGILCGQCTKGLSLMLGSNQCGQCTNDYLVLIIPFAVAGIALVAFLIALNLTVSVGTINGLIFYANVVKIYEPIFFPNGPVKPLSQFTSWINLDLGIETCFFDGMDSCSKAWLQFVFPGYVWFLLILIIILSQYSSKVVRLVGSNAVPVLATMILLSYTKLIRTVFQALYFINIQCNGDNNVTLLRWYIDANVQYVGGYCHLPLFIFSLVVLILLIVPYTFYLLTIPLFEGPLSKYMCCCQKLSTYMKPFFDAYGGPYKDRCRFWTGFLLLVRIILALVVSLDTEATISLDVLTSILFVIISMYFLLKGIYRHLPLACLEMSFFLNLMFMAYVNVQTCEKSRSSQVLSLALVSISFVVFCGIILYHVWDCLSKSRLKQPIAKIMMAFKKPRPAPSTDDTEIPLVHPGSPALICETSSVTVVSVVMRRESLLDDEDD